MARLFKWLRSRGLKGVRLIIGDKCLGMLEAAGEVFPEAKYQRCIVHFYRNIISATPRSKVKQRSKNGKSHSCPRKQAGMQRESRKDCEGTSRDETQFSGQEDRNRHRRNADVL